MEIKFFLYNFLYKSKVNLEMGDKLFLPLKIRSSLGVMLYFEIGSRKLWFLANVILASERKIPIANKLFKSRSCRKCPPVDESAKSIGNVYSVATFTPKSQQNALGVFFFCFVADTSGLFFEHHENGVRR